LRESVSGKVLIAWKKKCLGFQSDIFHRCVEGLTGPIDRAGIKDGMIETSLHGCG